MATAKDTMQLIPDETTKVKNCVCFQLCKNFTHGWSLTYYELVGHPRRHHFKVLEGRQDALDIAEHGGEAEEEQHDEEQDGPDLRARH